MSRRKPQSINWGIRQINTMINKGSILFTHPLQRPTGQWSDAEKSLLVDSLLTLYCPDVFAIKEKTENGNTYSIIDGLQRLSTISDLINEKLTMTELEDFSLESTGDEVYNISGKKFSQFPKEVQDEIMTYTLGLKVFEIEEGDDEEEIIEEIFYRLNNGKAMSNEHKALVKASHKVQRFVHRIATEHKLFNGIAKYSEKAVKKSDIPMTIMQSILLISGLDYTSFASKDVEQVFSKNEMTDRVLELTEKSFDAIVKAFPEQHKFVTKISISAMAYLFANSLDHDETTAKLLDYINNKIKPGDAYKGNTGAGCTKKDRVTKRIKGLLSLCEVQERELEVKSVEQDQEEQPELNQETQESTITADNEEFGEESDEEEPNEEIKEEAETILNIINNVA